MARRKCRRCTRAQEGGARLAKTGAARHGPRYFWRGLLAAHDYAPARDRQAPFAEYLDRSIVVRHLCLIPFIMGRASLSDMAAIFVWIKRLPDEFLKYVALAFLCRFQHF